MIRSKLGSNIKHRVGQPKNTTQIPHVHSKHSMSSIPLMQHHVNDIGKIEGMSFTNIIYFVLAGLAVLAFLLSILALAGFIDYRDIPIAAIKEKIVINKSKNDDTTTLIENDTIKFKTVAPSSSDGVSISIDNTNNSIELDTDEININNDALVIPDSSASITTNRNINLGGTQSIINASNVGSKTMTLSDLGTFNGGITMGTSSSIGMNANNITGTGNIYMGDILGNTFTSTFSTKSISGTSADLDNKKLNYNSTSPASFVYTLPSAAQGSKLSYFQQALLGATSADFDFKCQTNETFEGTIVFYGGNYVQNTATDKNVFRFESNTLATDFLTTGTIINFWCITAGKWYVEVNYPSGTSTGTFSFQTV
jgi:uncharacterized protein YdaT